jgi:hypothetical protein
MMSGKSPLICHCEWNAVERGNRKILGLLPFGRNDGSLNGDDIISSFRITHAPIWFE